MKIFLSYTSNTPSRKRSTYLCRSWIQRLFRSIESKPGWMMKGRAIQGVISLSFSFLRSH